MHPPRVGPYLIDRKIGAGGMANVYLGRHVESGRVAAVKTLPASMARVEGFVLRFNREIEALQKLNHPNIVKLFESGKEDDETYFYAMEYVDGETLSSRLRRDRRIAWPEAIQLAIQICAGLKHAHDVGIVHRDLKPSNLLIAGDGTIKISDFGVAQVFSAEQLTVTGAIIGTAEFMSPEQVEGRRADRRSDLYSLGAVLYTMIVGQPPFLGSNSAEIMQKHRFGRFDSARSYVPAIPSWLDDVINQLLEKDPEKRIPDAYVLSKRLQEVVKKVELKNSERPSAVPLADAVTLSAEGAARPRAMGETMVRELVQAATSRTTADTSVERLFDKTWVLVLLLLLVLGGLAGLVWFWPSGMEGPSGDSRTEPDRILQAARWSWKSGDAAAAKRQLESLRAVIAGDERQEAKLRAVDRLLSAIRNQQPTFQQAFIRDALTRAAQIAPEDRPRAEAIWSGIIDLYASDRSVADLVEEARRNMAPRVPHKPESSGRRDHE
jgi:Protein kinase domain